MLEAAEKSPSDGPSKTLSQSYNLTEREQKPSLSKVNKELR